LASRKVVVAGLLHDVPGISRPGIRREEEDGISQNSRISTDEYDTLYGRLNPSAGVHTLTRERRLSRFVFLVEK
jgi:hypothetical protein